MGDYNFQTVAGAPQTPATHMRNQLRWFSPTLLSEQNVKSTLKLSDRGYIIDNGRIRYHGSIEEMKENDEVRKACGI